MTESLDIAAAALSLQKITVFAILFFGVIQVIFSWRSHQRDKASERQHQETMAAFEARRKDADQQHQDIMAAFEARRKDADHHHDEVMEAWRAASSPATAMQKMNQSLSELGN